MQGLGIHFLKGFQQAAFYISNNKIEYFYNNGSIEKKKNGKTKVIFQ